MIKQIEIHGQRIELYSPDQGRTWSSNPRAIVAYGQRKKTLRLDLQNARVPYSNARANSSTLSPALRIRLRSVPRATSRWSGTESVAG